MTPGKQDNTKLYVAGGIAVMIVLCFGFATSLVSAFVVSWMTRPDVVAQQQEGPKGPLRITRPGQAVKLPPLPANITRGPKMPESPFDRDQCSDIMEGGPVEGPDCITAEIQCDEMVIGHTIGGVERFDNDFYEKKFCWPRLIDHDGGDERVYKLTMPPGEWRAWVTLHSPCADLDVVGIRHDRDTCPDFGSTINQCEMKPESSTRSERIELTSQTKDDRNAIWYIAVEGKRSEEGPFSLHVQCARGLSGGY